MQTGVLKGQAREGGWAVFVELIFDSSSEHNGGLPKFVSGKTKTVGGWFGNMSLR